MPRPRSRSRRALALTLVPVLAASGLLAVGNPGAQGEEPSVEVLIVFDTTGSMGSALGEAKAQVTATVAEMQSDYEGLRVGVAAVSDYAPDVPWTLLEPLTTDLAAVQQAVDGLYASGGGDGPEAYGRALYEAAQSSEIGWSASAKRILILVNDNVPHDRDLNEGVPVESQTQGSPFDTGTDPGRDGLAGTDDDIDWQDALSGLSSAGIVFGAVFYNGADAYLPYWEWWTKQTGGAAAVGGAGTPLGDLLGELVDGGVTGATPCHYRFRWSRLDLTFDYLGAHRYLGNAHQAAQNWSSLGVGLSITPVRNGRKAQITFRDVNDPQSKGIYASAQVQRVSKEVTTEVSDLVANPENIVILVNRAGMDGLTDAQRTYTLTHEIGHALGLAHTDGECGNTSESIMRDGSWIAANGWPSWTTPRSYDVANLRLRYDLGG